MQTLIQVVCSKGPSLRDAIVNDARLESYGLYIEKRQKPGRANGWAKILSRERDRRGALNIHWDAAAHILSCRVVNRGSGRPNRIVGDFVDYLFARRRGRVRAVNIYPR